MNLAQSLHVELGIVYKATTSANGFIVQVSVTFIALVVDLNELDLSDEAENFDHMPHNLVSWDGLYELYSVVSLEVCHRTGVFDLSNDSKVCYIEDKLDVDIDLIGNFPQCVFDKKDVTSLKRGFQIDTSSVFDEESDFRFVIS